MADIVDRLLAWTHSVDSVAASDLMDEAADEIRELRRLRVEDGKQMSALIDGHQKMQALCIDGKYLADAERDAIERARLAFRDMDHNDMTMQQLEDYEALCDLMERIGGGQ
jgi:hypothetical protein